MHNIFKVMKGKKLQPRILYITRLSLRFKEVNSFTDKDKGKERKKEGRKRNVSGDLSPSSLAMD